MKMISTRLPRIAYFVNAVKGSEVPSRGIFATEDIAEGSPLFTLSWASAFSLNRVELQFPKVYATFETNGLIAEDALAIALMYYKHCSTISEVSEDDASWIEALPESLDSGLYFTDSEMEYLKGSPAFVHAMIIRTETRELYDKLATTMFNQPPYDKCAITWERFKWAVATVQSRKIYTETPSELTDGELRFGVILAPFIDFFNHASDAHATYELDHEASSIRVTSIRPIKKGQEIFLNYGHQDCGSDLVIDYGFLDEKSETNCVNILFEELLETIPDNDPKIVEKISILEKSYEENQRLKLFKDSLTEELLKLSKYLSYKNQSLLVYIKDLIQLKTNNYPTTLETDLELVKSKEYKELSYRSRMAIKTVLLEKQILLQIGQSLQAKIDESEVNNSTPQQQQQTNAKDEL
eukprot:gene12906-15160_t